MRITLNALCRVLMENNVDFTIITCPHQRYGKTLKIHDNKNNTLYYNVEMCALLCHNDEIIGAREWIDLIKASTNGDSGKVS